jgi:hemerythrin superfamily protein
MLEKLLGRFPDVIQMLRDDHKRVRNLFAEYAKAQDQAKPALAKIIIHELEVHAGVEEQLIYPAFRKVFKDSGMLNEAVEEHHLVHVLIKELKGLKGNQETFEAKLTVLRELVKHHVDEEEGQMFPKAEAQDLDWARLYRDAEALKKRLAAKTVTRRTVKRRPIAA